MRVRVRVRPQCPPPHHPRVRACVHRSCFLTTLTLWLEHQVRLRALDGTHARHSQPPSPPVSRRAAGSGWQWLAA
eukprot:COSAG01_NODE_16043_length_1275_cov_1.239796_2_plen_75_part_00